MPNTPKLAYVPQRRWILVGCDETGDFPGLFCEIAALSNDEAGPLRSEQTYPDLAAKVAPFVRSWNIALPNPETGAPVSLPPPAEAGPSVFDRIDKGIIVWIRTMLINGPFFQEHPTGDDPNFSC
jgi:hypothetical protein